MGMAVDDEHVNYYNASMKLALVLALAGRRCSRADRARFASGYMYSYYVPQSASTPWRPAWSPDGRFIVYTGEDSNGCIPGDEIHLPARVHRAARKLEVYFNGRVIESSDGSPICKRISINGSGWITLRASSSKPQHTIDDSYVVGETSAIYVYKGDQPIR